MRNLSNNKNNFSGFTLIELIVTTSLFIALLGIFWTNFSTLPSRTTLISNHQTLISDIKSQQTMAMSGQNSYGVYFSNNSYILFEGSSYDQNNPTNFTVNLDNDNLSFDDNLFLNQVIIFQSGSGEILNFDENNNSLSLSDNLSGASQLVRLNLYGATY